MKIKIVVFLYFLTFSVVYSQEFISINKTENIPTQSYYEKNASYSTNQDKFEIVISSYQISYKIWTLYGEPVFDFKLKWDSPSLDHLSQLKNIPIWFYNNVGEDLPILLDADLIQKMKKIKPLSFKFVFQLYNKDYKLGLLSNQYLDESYLLSLQKYKIFNIDVINESGKFSQFSVPASPDWEDLHPGYLEIIKNTKDLADLYINNIRLTEVEWPQYEIESILVEQINRNNKKNKLKEEISNDDDFWDTPDTNTSRNELPLAKVKSKKNVTNTNKSSYESNKVKNFDSINELVSFEQNKSKELTLNVNPNLGNFTIKGKRNGKYSWIKENINWKNIVLTEINSDFIVEFWKNGIKIGYVPIIASKYQREVYKVGDAGPAGGIVFYDKGAYSDGWRYFEAASPLNNNHHFNSNGIYYNDNGPTNSSEIGAGFINTKELAKIVKDRGLVGSTIEGSASIIFNKEMAGYNDWFVPSLDELEQLYYFLKSWENTYTLFINEYHYNFFSEYQYSINKDFSKYSKVYSSTSKYKSDWGYRFYTIDFNDRDSGFIDGNARYFTWPIRRF